MSGELIGLLGLVFLGCALALRMPVALAMLLTGISGNYALSLVYPHLKFIPVLRQFKTLLWNNLANFDLSVVPLFILMGYLVTESKLNRDLFAGANALLGKLPGGAALAALFSCASFGAVCGSSLATASAMGGVALPELKKLKYHPSFACGLLAAGGTLGILIPPSVVLVVYAVIVEASISTMFQAAILPALLAVAFYACIIFLFAKLKPSWVGQPVQLSAPERRKTIVRMLPVVGLFSVIMLGLGLGLFTPTPAAGISVLVVLGYGLFLRKFNSGLSLAGIKNALLATAKTSGMIYFILFGAAVLTTFFARSGLLTGLADWAVQSQLNPFLVLVAVLIMLILLGCVVESLAMITVILPFFWPILVELNGGMQALEPAFGMSTEELKIWFGVLALVMVELGLITPPVGLNVLIIHSLSKDSTLSGGFIGVLPFLGAELIRVILLLLIPTISLLLPRLLS